MVTQKRWYRNGTLKRLAIILTIVTALGSVAYSYGYMASKLEGVEKSVIKVEDRVAAVEQILMSGSKK